MHTFTSCRSAHGGGGLSWRRFESICPTMIGLSQRYQLTGDLGHEENSLARADTPRLV